MRYLKPKLTTIRELKNLENEWEEEWAKKAVIRQREIERIIDREIPRVVD
jgi:hypothetical protein